jgi:hypothetical protein
LLLRVDVLMAFGVEARVCRAAKGVVRMRKAPYSHPKRRISLGVPSALYRSNGLGRHFTLRHRIFNLDDSTYCLYF